MLRHLAALVALGVVSASCSPDARGRDASFTVTDSAGVQIVVHARPAAVDSVADAPLLSIGREGDPSYEFFRVTAVLGLANGNMVVANGGTSELRFYDQSGALVRTVGASGEGPQEFGSLNAVWLLPHDSLAVIDTRRRRWVLVDAGGGFHREQSLATTLALSPQPAGIALCFPPIAAGLLADRSLVVRGTACAPSAGATERRPMGFPLYVVKGGRMDTLGTYNFGDVWVNEGAADPRQRFVPVPFPAAARIAVGRDRIYATSGAQYQVDVYAPDGRLVRILRESRQPSPIPQPEVSKYRAEQEAAGRPLPTRLEFPERFPAYRALILSTEGDLWAQHYAPPDSEHQTWAVFSADGTSLRYEILPRIDLMSVRADRLYGVRTSAMDVQIPTVLSVTR
jgi:hypothetical protein